MASTSLVILAVSLLQLLSGTAGDVSLRPLPPAWCGFLNSMCFGEKAKFDWSYTKDPSDQILSIKWTLRQADASKRLLATWTPQKQYWYSDVDRIANLNNAGIIIDNLRATDSGNVTVEITYTNNTARTSSSTQANHTVSRVATLFVADEPKVVNNQLELRLNTSPYQTSTGVYPASIRCGRFQNRGNPVIHPLIKLPNGSYVKIHDYANSWYILPVNAYTFQAGTYQCHLPDTNCTRVSTPPRNLIVTDTDQKKILFGYQISQLLQEQTRMQEELKQTRQELNATKKALEETRKESITTKEALELNTTKKSQEQPSQESIATNEALEETRQELNTTNEALEETRQELKTTKEAQEQNRQKLNSTKEALEEIRQEMVTTKEALGETRQELKAIKEALEQTRQHLRTVETGEQMRQELNCTREEQTNHSPQSPAPAGGDGLTSQAIALLYVDLERLEKSVTQLRHGYENKINETERKLEEYKGEIDGKLSQKRCEAGERQLFKSLAYKGVQEITFTRPFLEKPFIIASFTFIDVDYRSNVRLNLTTLNITTTGFRLDGKKWSNTKCNALKIAWMACSR